MPTHILCGGIPSIGVPKVSAKGDAVDDYMAAFGVGKSSNGDELKFRVLRVDDHEVVLQADDPAVDLSLSSWLDPVRIEFRSGLRLAGRALIQELVNTGTSLVCRASVQSAWTRNDPTSPNLIRDSWEADLRRFRAPWAAFLRIRPTFKVLVTDMESHFSGLRMWAAQTDLRIATLPDKETAPTELAILDEVSPSILRIINELFGHFEQLSLELEPAQRPIHFAFLKDRLHPYLLCAPFAHRAYAKPLGYAGDYEMVNMMLRSPYEGRTLYEKLINAWFLSQPPAEAHRNRIALLTERLGMEAARVKAAGRSMRVLSLGVGPAHEIQQFLRQWGLSDHSLFTLVDFNAETIEETQQILNQSRLTGAHATRFEYIQKPVLKALAQLTRNVSGPAPNGGATSTRYDFAYCAGLLDYLTDVVSARVLSQLWTCVAPGGLMLVTNVESANPLRHGMEHLLDWHLIHRTPENLRSLAPAEIPEDQVSIRSDFTGVNLLLEARKQVHA